MLCWDTSKDEPRRSLYRAANWYADGTRQYFAVESAKGRMAIAWLKACNTSCSHTKIIVCSVSVASPGTQVLWSQDVSVVNNAVLSRYFILSPVNTLVSCMELEEFSAR